MSSSTPAALQQDAFPQGAVLDRPPTSTQRATSLPAAITTPGTVPSPSLRRMGTPLQAATPLRVNLNQPILAPAAVSPIFPQVRTTGLRQTTPNPLLNASSAQSTRPHQLIPAPLLTPPHQTSITNRTRERPQAPTISQPRFLPQPTYPSQAAAPSQTGVIPQTVSLPGLSQTALDFQQASATAHLPHNYAPPTVTSPPMTAASPGANTVSDGLRERRATWSVARMDRQTPPPLQLPRRPLKPTRTNQLQNWTQQPLTPELIRSTLEAVALI